MSAKLLRLRQSTYLSLPQPSALVGQHLHKSPSSDPIVLTIAVEYSDGIAGTEPIYISLIAAVFFRPTAFSNDRSLSHNCTPPFVSGLRIYLLEAFHVFDTSTPFPNHHHNAFSDRSSPHNPSPKMGREVKTESGLHANEYQAPRDFG